MAKVKFKFGTWAKYDALTVKDPDTLYLITDKGIFYKGDQAFVGVKSALVANSGSGEAHVATLTVENSVGDNVTFTVPSTTALAAVKTALQNALTTHVNTKGNASAFGHVKLSNAINSISGEGDGVAATPKAVKDAYDALVKVINGAIAANDAMVFKGTLGTGGTVTALPTTGYKTGWTYRVVSAGTFAGQVCEVGDMVIAVKNFGTAFANTDWGVVQANIDGAVVAPANLAVNQLVVGNGDNKSVKKLAAGTNGQFLRMDGGIPKWVSVSIADEKVTVTDTGTTVMYILGAASATGNQTAKSKATLKFSGGDTLEAPKFKGDGAGLTSLNPNNLSNAVPVSKGGTGATTAPAARTNLGLGTAAVKNVAAGITASELGLPTGAQVSAAITSSIDNALNWEEIA